MRLPTRERASLTESTSPAQRDLFDAVPTRGRSPTANRPRGWVWLAARSLVAVAATRGAGPAAGRGWPGNA
jgi:hypothetical protein